VTARRAPLGRRERGAAIVALAVAAAVIALVAWGGLGRNLVYSWGPSELKAAGACATGAAVRLGGLVAEGSVVQTGDGLAFRIFDGREQVAVHTHGLAPPMFREGVAVVVEGSLGPDGVFDGTRLMVSHGNEYRAGVAQAERPP
jgi:cytochrome c-type biogenesis protein CcmE